MIKVTLNSIDNKLDILVDEKPYSLDELYKSVSTLSFEVQQSICFELKKLWEFMPEGELGGLAKLPEDHYKKNIESDSITIYGGSFNPWHRGHLECLLQCPEDNILVVPDANPWKENKNKAPLKDYLTLCEQLSRTGYSVYPGFIALEESNPTVDWIFDVKKKRKNLLIGDDNFFSFLKWKDVKRLCLELHTIYVVPRLYNEDSLTQVKNELVKLNPRLSVKFLNNHNYQQLSSTALRYE